MNKLILLFSLLLFFPQSGNSQNDKHGLVGFACSAGGEQSKEVNLVEALVLKKKYSKVQFLLYSDNKALQFLAVVVCEKLVSLEKLELNQEELDRISKIRKSEALVTICSGCRPSTLIPLKDLFEPKNHIRQSSHYWIDGLFERIRLMDLQEEK